MIIGPLSHCKKCVQLIIQKKVGVNMSKKIGRPRSTDPKRNIVGCKLTDTELQLLTEYCSKNNVSKSNVIKSGIKHIINP